MVTSNYADFFLGCAGAAASLIGLLFVAVSVAAERTKAKGAETGMQMRASAALLCFSNVMVVSLFSLTPNTNVGWPATIVGSIGLLFALASGSVLLRSWSHRSPGSLGLVLGFLALFGLRCSTGLRRARIPTAPVRSPASPG